MGVVPRFSRKRGVARGMDVTLTGAAMPWTCENTVYERATPGKVEALDVL